MEALSRMKASFIKNNVSQWSSMIVKHRMFWRTFSSSIIFETLRSWKKTKTRPALYIYIYIKQFYDRKHRGPEKFADMLKESLIGCVLGFLTPRPVLFPLPCTVSAVWNWRPPSMVWGRLACTEGTLGGRGEVSLAWDIFRRGVTSGWSHSSHGFFPVLLASAVTEVLCLWGEASSGSVWG